MTRLLVCDDSADSRKLIRVLIGSHPDIEIVGEAGSGCEAIERATELEPDVVLMDVQMPDLGGVEATQRLKELLPAIRIVAFAASAEEGDIKAMIEAGASAYCVKGCSAWELQREIVGSADPLTRLAHLLSRGVPGSVGRLVARELAESTGAVLTALYVGVGGAPIMLLAAQAVGDVDLQGPVPAIGRRCLTEGAPVQATADEREELRGLGILCGEVLAVPVGADAIVLGVLLLAMPEGAEHIVDADFVCTAADLAAGALTNEQLVVMMQADARRDMLTGLLNRRAFEETLELMLPQAHDEERPISLILFDVDNFKSINDELGHAGGDETLRQLARIVLRTVRADEEAFRVGGDEFAVVVRGSSSTAAAVAGRIEAAILRQRHAGAVYTISAGISSFPLSSTAEQLLSHADEAMYEGKQGGKDRMTIHRSAVSDPPLARDSRRSLRSSGPISPRVDRVLIDDSAVGAQTRVAVQVEPIALERALLQQAFHETMEAFTNALAAKDSVTAAHSKHVVRYARVLTEALAPGLLELRSLEYGFLLHDIGKIGIPDEILLKPGPLSEHEIQVMQTHTELGEQWLTGVPLLQGHGLQVIRSHHERWDGGGYPDGLSREQIPIGGRIFAVADALDAMTSSRPYRAAISWAAAAREVGRERGRQFDPEVVDAFGRVEGMLEAIHDELAAAATV